MTNKNKQNNNSQWSDLEEQVLDFWQKEKIFEKSIKKEAPNGDYVFYDGPPFITGLPHYATLLPSIAKDVVPRYQTMKGFKVERVWGWDCHGLPAENKVEKELDLKNKKDIEELGVDKFTNACRDYVSQTSAAWDWYINRIGRWVDMQNAYKTMDLDFMESVMWGFKELYNKDFIYEGYRTSLHCPRCATPLSKFEITMDAGSYKDVDDTSVVVKFKIRSPKSIKSKVHKVKSPISVFTENIFFLAWTTTPWTLPGNLALAVGENIDYVLVKIIKIKTSANAEIFNTPEGQSRSEKSNYIISDENNLSSQKTEAHQKDAPLKNNAWVEGVEPSKRDFSDLLGNRATHTQNSVYHEYYILAKDRLEEIFKDKEYEIVKELKGKDLLGMEYEPVFDLNNKKIKEVDKYYKVYEGSFVNTEDGTGIVHIAPNFGEDDFNLAKLNDFPIIDLMDENGHYTKEAGEWSGLYFKKANTKALEDLGEKKFLELVIKHSYPFCYRCNSRLIHKTQKAWYLNVEKIRSQLLKTNEDIKWTPEHFKQGRFQKNLESAPDWCVSRSRYWGSPLPVWKCGTKSKICENIKVIGSIEELEKLSGSKITDLHRPAIDGVEFECDKCGGAMKRVPEVLDCWMESGSMPFAQFHYPFGEKKDIKKIMPADFIVEYTGQLRGWFYYLHVLSNCLFNSKSFKNVIVTGVLAGTDGRKMSKSFGNYPDPQATIEKYGADALRCYFMSSPIMLGGDMSMSERDIQNALRKNVVLLWNVVKFYEIFGDELKVESIKLKVNSSNILDQWILIRLNQLVDVVTENMDNYNIPNAIRPIQDFIDDLSTWYLRRSRDRFKGDDEKDKQIALSITNFVLLELSKVMAPFMPFIAEQVWQKMTGNNFNKSDKSVHLENWPSVESVIKEEQSKIIAKMEAVRKVVELGLAKRDESQIKVRQPLSKLLITNFDPRSESRTGLQIESEYQQLIKDEVNVKMIEIIEGKGELKVELDTEITEELKQEGIKRELVRFINNLRKNANMTIQDKVIVYYQANKEIEKVFDKFTDVIKKDVLAQNIENLKKDDCDIDKEIKIDHNDIWLGLNKK